MTDTTTNPGTFNPNDRDARLDLLTETVEKLTLAMQAFAGGAVSLLSGQPQTEPVRRGPGRPKNSKNKPKIPAIAAAPIAAPVAQPIHPKQIEMLSLISQAGGRMTQTELARAIGGSNSLVEYHLASPKNERNALREGRVIKRVTQPKGIETIVYYTPGTVIFKGE